MLAGVRLGCDKYEPEVWVLVVLLCERQRKDNRLKKLGDDGCERGTRNQAEGEWVSGGWSSDSAKL